VRVLATLRLDLAERERRFAVHAAVGAIQPTLFFHGGLAARQLTELLDVMAHGCLGVAAASPLSHRTGTDPAAVRPGPART
jgi:hypothetical protein